MSWLHVIDVKLNFVGIHANDRPSQTLYLISQSVTVIIKVDTRC